MRGVLNQVRLSIVIANYNGMGTLPGMLASLKAYPYPLEEIIVVDDGSSDGSVDWLRATHPNVRLVAFEANTGNLAQVRNAGLQAAQGTHAFLTDNDIEFLPDCLHRLLEVIVADERVFCVTPRLVYYDRPDVIFQDGNGMHFLALGTGNLRGVKVADAGVPAPFATCGGGMMLFDLARARQVGGFDPGYMHAWADDGEYQLRGTLYGFRCLHVPAAAAMHHAKDHGAGRALGQIHNRFRVLLTFYRARTLLVLLPSLLMFELALISGSIVHGFGGAYFGAVRRTWRERREIGSMRREMQGRRRVSDAELLRGGPFEFPGAVQPGRAVRAATYLMQKLFDANWLVARWVQ